MILPWYKQVKQLNSHLILSQFRPKIFVLILSSTMSSLTRFVELFQLAPSNAFDNCHCIDTNRIWTGIDIIKIVPLTWY